MLLALHSGYKAGLKHCITYCLCKCESSVIQYFIIRHLKNIIWEEEALLQNALLCQNTD